MVVSTDIGGTDPDDFQSMVHLLLYADVLELEGLISSPYGPGRKEHLLQVIAYYERDYANLRTHSPAYPTPDALRAIAKQGETESAPYAGVRQPTEGSAWIVQCARRADARPLHVLVWGGLEDLAQALHDAPDIRPKLRVYFIGGPNKKWSVDAYHSIVTRHPQLWIIEANATYRGWFVGGKQDGEWGNAAFVARHVAGKGALGDFFATQLGGTLKMGDSPSVGWLLRGEPAEPMRPGWGGQFVRAWERAPAIYDRVTTRDDRIEQFGVFELRLPRGAVPAGTRPEARLEIENQSLPGFLADDGTVRFRFSPKDAKRYAYTIRSNVPGLDGRRGELTSVPPDHDAARLPARLPNWWTDDPSPDASESGHIGARGVSRWREEVLGDFAARLRRCGRER